MTTDAQQIQARLPLTLTAYSSSGRMLCRFTMTRPGQSFTIPKDLRKRVARTETMDANGDIVATWTAPWATEEDAA